MKPPPTVDPDNATSWVPGPDLDAAMCPGEFVWGTAVADRGARLLLRDLHQSGGDHDGALQHLSALTTRIAAVRDHVEQTIGAIARRTRTSRRASESDHRCRHHRRRTRVLGILVDDAIKSNTDARVRCTSDEVRRAILAVEIITHAAGHLPFGRPARFDLVRMGPDVACPALPSSNGDDLRPSPSASRAIATASRRASSPASLCRSDQAPRSPRTTSMSMSRHRARGRSATYRAASVDLPLPGNPLISSRRGTSSACAEAFDKLVEGVVVDAHALEGGQRGHGHRADDGD